MRAKSSKHYTPSNHFRIFWNFSWIFFSKDLTKVLFWIFEILSFGCLTIFFRKFQSYIDRKSRYHQCSSESWAFDLILQAIFSCLQFTCHHVLPVWCVTWWQKLVVEWGGECACLSQSLFSDGFSLAIQIYHIVAYGESKTSITWKKSNCRAKRSEIWDSQVVVIHIWDTFGLVTFKVILRSFGALSIFPNLGLMRLRLLYIWIGNHIWRIPMTPSHLTLSDFGRSSHSGFEACCKGTELGHMLLLNINRKAYMGSPMTLILDLEWPWRVKFEVTHILKLFMS